MDYNQFRNPKKKKPATPASKGKTATASLRAVSYLWDTTVPYNPFGTDGEVANVPAKWPGDDLRVCRHWHGVDLAATFKPDGLVDPDSITLRALSYSGQTDTYGLIGKTTVSDRHVTEPRADAPGKFVEVKTLLGTRVGAFIPNIKPALPPFLPGLPESSLVQYTMEKLIEKISEGRYLGTDPLTPKIYTYARLRLYADKAEGDWVSSKRGSGFVSQALIIKRQLGSSWIPEHHLYVNGDLVPSRSLVPASSDELLKWIDSVLPGDAFGYRAVSAALELWAKETKLAEKHRTALAFARDYPDYFIGTKF